MTPQQLIDMRGAGNAGKWLRKNGKWRELMTDTERIEWIALYAEKVSRQSFGQIWDIEYTVDDDYDVDFFRQDVDSAACKLQMEAK